MDYKICIPSYNRYDIFKTKTFLLLQKNNLIDKSILFIQSDDDEKKYSEFGIKIVRGDKGYCNICNTITDYLDTNQKYVLMGDDITNIVIANDEKKTNIVDDLDSLFIHLFNIMEQEQASLGGFYPVPNSKWMYKSKPVTTDLRFIYDPVCCIINNGVKIDIDGKADYYRTIEHYKMNKKIIRLNHYSIKTKYNSGNGGIGKRDLEKIKNETDMFVEKYKNYISRIITHKNGTTSFLLKKNPI
jgi:hypothetical protein